LVYARGAEEALNPSVVSAVGSFERSLSDIELKDTTIDLKVKF
jgi:hypothetical protein